MVKRFFTALLLFGAAVFLFAEGSLTMDFSIMNTAMRTRAVTLEIPVGETMPVATIGDSYWGLGTSGSAGMAFKSSGNRNVKAEVSFDFNFPEQEYGGASIPIITLDRAYVKARFPVLRLTAGKTRLGWGDGFVFNSGDVIFGSTSPYVDLTASEIRTETDWMTAINIPFGRFSFLEGLIMTPEADADAGKYFGEIQDLSAGGRIYTKVGGIKVEAGYMFRGNSDSPLHRPYLALQGNLVIDWYLSGSVALPASLNASQEEIEDGLKDSFNISGGLFHIQELNRVSSMTFRIESLVMPFMAWEESSPATTAEIPTYGLLLYPEILYLPSDTLSLSLRSVVSPIDISAQITAGGSWNIFQGFSILGYATINAGEKSDTFAIDRSNGVWRAGTDIVDGYAFSLGVSYIY
ncbi:MAG: hypothetical protein JEY99_00755 [Spirochaetales bacterium]|nr:hypothetical protein [Spirochaetales bacterium]